MVSHPPHQLDQMNGTTPSTFIPFCAFQTKLGIFKPFTVLPNSSFPMCTSFTPVAMGGQLCYNLKLNMTGRNGRNSGLVLVLDMNEDRSLSFDFSYHPEIPKDDTVLRLDEVRQDDVSTKAKVYIRLLVPYVQFGGGSYQMTSVKSVKGTDAFLGMQENERKCKHEKTEECENHKIYKKCSCVPWELQSVQVSTLLHLSFNSVQTLKGFIFPVQF